MQASFAVTPGNTIVRLASGVDANRDESLVKQGIVEQPPRQVDVASRGTQTTPVPATGYFPHDLTLKLSAWKTLANITWSAFQQFMTCGESAPSALMKWQAFKLRASIAVLQCDWQSWMSRVEYLRYQTLIANLMSSFSQSHATIDNQRTRQIFIHASAWLPLTSTRC